MWVCGCMCVWWMTAKAIFMCTYAHVCDWSMNPVCVNECACMCMWVCVHVCVCVCVSVCVCVCVCVYVHAYVWKCKRQLEDLLVIARARKHTFTQTINMWLQLQVYASACVWCVCVCMHKRAHWYTRQLRQRYGSNRNTKEKHVMNRMTAKNSLMFCMWVDN